MICSNMNVSIEDRCFELAQQMAMNNMVLLDESYSIFDLTDTLITMCSERDEKTKYTDSLIDYNDKIISIENVGEKETIDITVTGDNLFFCEGILTKNSIGIPAIADSFFAIIDSDDLRKLNQLLIKQLKNRYEDKNKMEKFVIGIDRAKMKLYDVEDSAQDNISRSTDIADEIPLFDKGKFGTSKRTVGFDGFIYD